MSSSIPFVSTASSLISRHFFGVGSQFLAAFRKLADLQVGKTDRGTMLAAINAPTGNWHRG
jgi:hypothetical protein